MALLEHNQGYTSQKSPCDAGEKNVVSAAHVYRLWDYQSLLAHRAQRSAGTERLLLLDQVDEVKKNIARYCGKNPRDFDELKKLMDKDR
ncbi:hypothetical protein [Magnetovibrio blakemorei]|uniref:hypothetical protein n=1 Tax=Magnetovibrio blakemorei TaxID=28181 RepID=UPI001112D9B4|nr:hypothetical protein [Magnetovibrio blakemorei]